MVFVTLYGCMTRLQEVVKPEDTLRTTGGRCREKRGPLKRAMYLQPIAKGVSTPLHTIPGNVSILRHLLEANAGLIVWSGSWLGWAGKILWERWAQLVPR